jgi:hypothetical protein
MRIRELGSGESEAAPTKSVFAGKPSKDRAKLVLYGMSPPEKVTTASVPSSLVTTLQVEKSAKFINPQVTSSSDVMVISNTSWVIPYLTPFKLISSLNEHEGEVFIRLPCARPQALVPGLSPVGDEIVKSGVTIDTGAPGSFSNITFGSTGV